MRNHYAEHHVEIEIPWYVFAAILLVSAGVPACLLLWCAGAIMKALGVS